MILFFWHERYFCLDSYDTELTEHHTEYITDPILWEKIIFKRVSSFDFKTKFVLTLYFLVTLFPKLLYKSIICYECTAHLKKVKSSKEHSSKSCVRESPNKKKSTMFGVLPDDHHAGIELKDNLPREDEKSTTEATTRFEVKTPQTVRNNFFIDASSLLDESEVNDVQNNKCSDLTRAPPPPLIRRKTFELEADDDKVAVLRQEYERRQGNALFQTCSLDAPSSLPVGLPRLIDNDVHTPDSLNNDGFEEVSDLRPESAPCDDDPNKNELVSPAPSPVGEYVAIHKDSIDAGVVLEDEPTDSEERVEDKINSIPIVSGGVAPEKVQSPMFSRRRTECAPILSGAAPPPEPVSPESSIEEKPRNLSASSAWVVDIRDIVSSPETRRKKESKSLSSSLGYFIDLKGSGSAVMQRSAGNSASPRDAGRKIIFSSSDKGSMESCMEKVASQESSLGVKPSKIVHSPEQKMFTMFIGLDKEESSEGKKDRPEPSARKKIVEEKLAVARKQPVYMYIGSESPSTNRKVLDQQEMFKKQHVRAKSLSTSAAAIYPDHHSQPTSIQQHHTSVGNFVRLSDLDKAPSRLSDSDSIISFTLENRTKSWKPKTTGPNCSDSLARVIPSIRDMSSTSFSGMEEENIDDENTPKEFWQDLRHVFVNNLCTDLIVEVAGRRIGAHKIVLTNRCPYFAAALSGGWVESGGNVIRLRGFSYPAVHFALYHIYIGTLTIPENMNIVELAMLCDLFHLDSLKETVESELAKRMCHSFHDPPNLKCACIPGTLETLVLAASYNLEYLYPECLRWCSNHFYKVCQTAPFVSLPNELKDKIFKTIASNCDKEELTKEEALELKVFTAVNATRLIVWAEKTDLARSSVSWFHRLKDETHKVVAKALNTLLSNSSSFHLLVRDTVDAVVLYSVQFLTPEELCLVYRILFLSRMEDTYKYPEGASYVLESLLDSVVMQLVGQASKVVRTRAWHLLDDTMQAPILEKAGFPRKRPDGPLQRSATDDKSFPRRDRLSSGGYTSGVASSGLIMPGGNRLQNLRQVKQVIAQHVNRANQGTLDPVPLRRSAVPVATTVKRREVKSRYLEIKSRPVKAKATDASVGQRHSYCAPATATSSDSSAITPTECLSDAVAAGAATSAAAHKRKGRPTSAPPKHVILPRRCASSSAVPAKDRLSAPLSVTAAVPAKDRLTAPPSVTAAVPAHTKRASTSSTSTSASASASAPTSATTSFSAKKLAGPTSRLNIPLRTCRSSSSVPQAASSVAIRKEILGKGENGSQTRNPAQTKSKAAPLKPVNGPRDRFRPVNGPPKRVNGLASKPNTRTVGCETNDLSNKLKRRTPLHVSRVRNGGASTSDMATDTSDIPPTPHDDDDKLSSKAIVLASRSGTFLKDEPTVLVRKGNEA